MGSQLKFIFVFSFLAVSGVFDTSISQSPHLGSAADIRRCWEQPGAVRARAISRTRPDGFHSCDESAGLLLEIHDCAWLEAKRIAQFLWNADVAVGLNRGVHVVKLESPDG